MSILYWDKPSKVMSNEQWRSIVADCAPPGVYTPNMSQKDELRWKAKFTGERKAAEDKCVEIRKTTDNGVQMLIRVYHDSVNFSLNGTAELSSAQFEEMQQAVAEAKIFLKEKIDGRR